MGCNCKQDLPSLATMAGNAVQSAGRVARAYFSGKKILVTPEVKAARLEVCNSCEKVFRHPKYPERIRCTVCGCHMAESWLSAPGFSKTELATESCPLGKWEAVK